MHRSIAFVLIACGQVLLILSVASLIQGALVNALFTLAGALVAFLVFLPRLARPVVRRMLPILVPQLSLFLLPVLFIPTALFALWAYPSFSLVLFAAAWALVWLAQILSLPFLQCPSCHAAYFRDAGRFRPDTLHCMRCGFTAKSPAA